MADAFTERRANGSYGPLFSANAAVSCIDRPWPKDVADYDGDASVARSAEPPELRARRSPTAGWRVPSGRRRRSTRDGRCGRRAPRRILVVGHHRRPGHALRVGAGLASQLQSGVLLTNVGDGHTSASSAAPQRLSSPQLAVTAYIVERRVSRPKGTAGASQARRTSTEGFTLCQRPVR